VSLRSAIDDIAAALIPLQSEVADLQVTAFWNDQPSPPSLDVYPGSPFMSTAAFDPKSAEVFMTVRARVQMADVESGQALLVRLLDTSDPASVVMALAAVDLSVVSEDGVSGFTQYADDNAAVERMLGCEWRVRTYL